MLRSLGLSELVTLTALARSNANRIVPWQAKAWSDQSLTEPVWNGIDAVEDAFGWHSDQFYGMFDKAGQWIEDAGVWASQTFGWNGFEVAGSFLAGMVRDVVEQIAGMIDIPGQIKAMIDTLSNLTMDDVLDGIQGALDVVGMIPVVGELLTASTE